jgi:hypothetical protein
VNSSSSAAAWSPARSTVIAALPQDQFDYRPRALANRRASSYGSWRASRALGENDRRWPHRLAPPTPTGTPAGWCPLQQSYEALSKRAAALDDERNRKGQFLVEGTIMQEPPLGQFLWYLF